jgi:hypothetical protein
MMRGLAGLPFALSLPRSAHAAADVASLRPQDLIESLVKMRGSIDGTLTYGWLDAVRSTVIDGEIRPFCRIVAGTAQRFRKIGEEVWEARLIEVAFYLDPQTNVLLRRVRMPGAAEDIEVPLYRVGPEAVRFAASLDERIPHEPEKHGSAAANFAPRGEVHLTRGVSQPRREGESFYLRHDEYGRVYQSPGAPPSVFYREWMIWRASFAALFEASSPRVSADFMYAALSSWRPWMKMGDVRGHTAENGRGAKVSSREEWPDELQSLVRENAPDLWNDPMFGVRA